MAKATRALEKVEEGGEAAKALLMAAERDNHIIGVLCGICFVFV